MRKRFLLLAIGFLSTTVNGQIFLEHTGNSFSGASFSSLAFADIDGDLDLDVLITGDTSNQGQPATTLYRNNGIGFFTAMPMTPFDAVYRSSVAFADVDGDGDLDVLITGATASQAPPIAKLYANDGSGVFTEMVGTPFQGVSSSAVVFADIDNDNDLDVLISGDISASWPSQPMTKLYTNDGSGVFTEATNTPFDALKNASIAFADIDGDADADLLVSGNPPSISPATQAYTPKLYTNNGSGAFTEETNTPFQGIRDPAVAFADIDGDSDMDLVMAGSDSSYQPITKLYTNSGTGTFTENTGSTFRAASSPSLAFANVNSDFYPDLLITGDSMNTSHTTLYMNDGSGGFTIKTGEPFIGVSHSSVGFADIDFDNDLDVLIVGDAAGQPVAKLYESTAYMGNLEHERHQSVRLFPNPVSKQLTISQVSAYRSLALYSYQGVLMGKFKVEADEFSMDVSQLPKGFYVISLSGDHPMNIPFLKE